MVDQQIGLTEYGLAGLAVEWTSRWRFAKGCHPKSILPVFWGALVGAGWGSLVLQAAYEGRQKFPYLLMISWVRQSHARAVGRSWTSHLVFRHADYAETSHVAGFKPCQAARTKPCRSWKPELTPTSLCRGGTDREEGHVALGQASIRSRWDPMFEGHHFRGQSCTCFFYCCSRLTDLDNHHV